MTNIKVKFKETEIGPIPEDWEIKNIENVFNVSAGGDLAKISFSKEKNDEFMYPIFSNTLINKGLYGYSKEYQYEPDCVTITARGDVGRAECRKEPFNAIVRLLVLKPKIEVSCYFAANYINTILGFQHVGSAVNQLTAPMISKRTIALPIIEEQEKIAEILGALDEKIELNRKMNKTLEEIGQAIFERASSRFERRTIQLKNLGKIVCGKTPSKSNKDFFAGAVPFIKIPDMHNQTFILTTEDSLTEIGRESQNNKTIPTGSIVVSCIATVGLVSITTEDSQTNQQINSIIPNNEELTYFLYLTLKNMKEELRNMASGGSATLNMNKGSFSEIEIKTLQDEQLLEFHSQIAPLFKLILNNSIEIETLSQIRDSLLPKLMSGKVRVK